MGRFLSPDPHIPDPTNAQNYNRYSYVNNNPLSFIDPSGFEDCAVGSDGCYYGSGGNGGDGGNTPYLVQPTPTGAASLGLPTSALDPGFFTGPNAEGNASDDLSEVTPTAQYLSSSPQLEGITVTGYYMDAAPAPTFSGFDFGQLGRALIPYNPVLATGQFLAIGVGGGTGFALSPVYAGIGATAGALGAGKSSNWDPTNMLIGAGFGSLTSGSFSYVGDAIGATGLTGVTFNLFFGGIGGGGTMAATNALSGRPVMNNVGYATAIGVIGPWASGESMIIGGAGYASDSALGYILNAGSNAFSVAVGP